MTVLTQECVASVHLRIIHGMSLEVVMLDHRGVGMEPKDVRVILRHAAEDHVLQICLNTHNNVIFPAPVVTVPEKCVLRK